MLIYEYLPHELVRLGVVSRAAGLDGRRVAAQVRLAQGRVGSARVLPAEPHHLSELFIAELRRLQWERIACLIEKERMTVYTPSHDRRAVRYEQQRLQRLVVDVAAAERSGGAAPEISRHRVYRIDARPAAGSRQDMPAPTVHLMAASPGEAAERAWAVHGRDGGLYRRGGGYRIASVEQALPEPGELF
ncbi:hypothetical protein [Streptomyces griseoruber]|uniref:Uncharacterized protein n=1 Tax=Streptomyces griseoruber TaxID=1943 RepID=A0A117R7D2_9ACTN|nr:hypothetical protein [Streptomyces griseoruber]KUN74956.1 hypothetical protein AQJ64_44515 [Streptomyces griseoruber]